jgi:hypothetical protein
MLPLMYEQKKKEIEKEAGELRFRMNNERQEAAATAAFDHDYLQSAILDDSKNVSRNIYAGSPEGTFCMNSEIMG